MVPHFTTNTPPDRHDASDDDIDEKIAKAKAEIQRIQSERSEAKLQHNRLVREMNAEIVDLTTLLKKEREKFQRNITVHKYATVLRDNATTPNAILILQAKLCRQIHIVCVEKAQLQLITDITKRLSSHAHKQVSDMVNDKNMLEMEILNKMAALQQKEREFQESCQQRIRTQSLEVGDIYKQLSDRSIEVADPTKLDRLVDRISDLNTKLQDQKNGIVNEEEQVPTSPKHGGSFQKEKKPMSRFEMRAKAMQKRAGGDSSMSPTIAKSLTGFSASIRNIVTDLSF